MIFKLLLNLAALTASFSSEAQTDYPYPVHYLGLSVENKMHYMAYMDVQPLKANGKSVILFHGKNFNGYYWKEVIPMLTEKGYRVIVPDQLGWGKSDRPDLHYSFHMLAQNNKTLLDSLHIDKITVLGHSTGGMLAIRFSLMYPDVAEKLIMEDPVGLEDYRTFVPYQTLAQLFAKEKAANYESYKKYQQGYYPAWKPEYEQYVQAQAADLASPDFTAIAWNNARTYDMIYQQPVLYELKNLQLPVLLIVGSADRTIVGKELLSDSVKAVHGNYPELGKAAAAAIPHCKFIIIPGAGHIAHIQEPEAFKTAIMGFL